MKRLCPLGVPLAPEEQVRLQLARSMLCERHHLRLSRQECIAAQLRRVRRNASGAPRSKGDCRQGIRMLLEAGILKKRRCPTCQGCRWVPEVEPLN